MIDFTASCNAVSIAAGRTRLAGSLQLPAGARGVVLYAVCGDPTRPIAQADHLAEALRRAGLGSLRLESVASCDAAAEYDPAQRSAHLACAGDWLAAEPRTRHLALGLFGSGGEAAAVLLLAARRPEQTAAVVASGGRPDLAGADTLARVRAPTLLIVGEQEDTIVEFNRLALDQLGGEKDLALVRGAAHPRGQQAALGEIARLAARWFQGYCGAESNSAPRG